MTSNVNIPTILNSNILPEVRNEFVKHMHKFDARIDRALTPSEITALERAGFNVIIYTNFNTGTCQCDYGGSRICTHPPAPVTTRHTVISLSKTPYIHEGVNDRNTIDYWTK